MTGPPRWIGWALLCLALLFLAPALLRDGALAIRGKRTAGIVTELRPSSRIRTPPTPVVRFTADNGAPVTFDGFAQHGQQYKPGDAVPVLYTPGEPRKAQIATWAAFWRGMTIALAVGITFLAGGVALLRRKREALVYSPQDGHS